MHAGPGVREKNNKDCKDSKDSKDEEKKGRKGRQGLKGRKINRTNEGKTMVRETRAVVHEVRAISDGGPMIEGHAAIFDQVTELAPKRFEVVRRGAFLDALTGDVRAYWNHDRNFVLGRTKAGTLELKEDELGLWYRVNIDPENSAAMNIHRSIMRGDVNQSSFSFMIETGGERFSPLNNGILREITRVKLYDVSPVAEPAYEGTDVEAREAFRNAHDVNIAEGDDEVKPGLIQIMRAKLAVADAELALHIKNGGK